MTRTTNKSNSSSFQSLAEAKQRSSHREIMARYETRVRRDRRFSLVHNVNIKGREAELTTLQGILRSYSSVDSRKPRAKLVVVSGPAGVGKTFLINEAFKNREWFVSGKYDQFSRCQSFAAVFDALKELIHLVSVSKELDDIMAEFKRKIGSENIQQLSKLIPGFGDLIELSEPDGLPHQDEMAFSLSFLKSAIRAFLESVANHIEKGPLVIVIDDVQWSDEPDMQLIEFLLASEHLTNIVIVTTYRPDDEEGSWVRQFIENLPDDTTKLAIGNLSAEAIATLLMDLTKRNEILVVKPLADFILKRTLGNAFFVIEFLRDLEDQELISYSLQNLRYEWDLNRIMSRIENLLDMLALRMTEMLEGNDLHVLTICACLGTRFSLDDLAEVLCGNDDSLTLDQVEAALKTSERCGMLDKLVSKEIVHYKFSHDRIKQCAYDQFKSDAEKAAIHWKIGSALLLSGNNNAKPDLLSAISQLNIAMSFGAENTLGRIPLARYNLDTAQQARSKYAFVPAIRLLRAGIDLLADDSPWSNHYDLMISLMTLLAEVEISIGAIESACSTIDTAINNADTAIDLAPFYKLKVKALIAQRDFSTAIETGLEGLALLGIKVKKKVSKLLLISYIMLLRFRWKKKSDAELLELPDMADERALLQSDIIAVIIMAAFQDGNEELTILLVIRQVLMQLKHGIHPSTFYICVWAGVCVAMDDIEEVRRIARLEARLTQRPSNVTTTGAMYMKYFQLHPANHLIYDSIDPLMDVYKFGLVSGDDPFMACVAGVSYVEYSIFCGSPLQPLLTTTLGLMGETKRYQQNNFYQTSQTYRLFISNLATNTNKNPLCLKDEEFDESEALSSSETSASNRIVILRYKTALSVFFRAPLDVKTAEPLLSMPVRIMKRKGLCTIWAMYPAIAMLTEAKEGRNRRKNLKRARCIMADYGKSVKNEDVNALVPYRILQAQYLAIQKRATPGEVQESFDTAIVAARRHGFNHFAGLVNVMAAEYFGELDDEECAIHYIKAAMLLYRSWGATHVTRVLGRKFILYLRRGSLKESSDDSDSVESGMKAELVGHDEQEALDALDTS